MSNTPGNAGLTEEEQAAMLELEAQLADTDSDDPLFNPEEVVAQKPGEQVEPGTEQEEEQEEEEQEELTPEEQKAKDDQDAADKLKADEEAAAAAAAAAAEAEKTEPQRSAPILVAEVPEGAEARLTEIATEKGALADKFDDGDMTSKEYQAELEKLNKEERGLERQIDKAQMAQDLENQRITNERMTEITTFLKEVGIPNDPKNLRFSVLNSAVIAVASEEANANLSATEVMQKAYDLCVEEGALQPKKAADPAGKPAAEKPAAKQKTPIKAPPSLAGLPASEISSTEDNRFAFLNRITDPDKREAAFNKLSTADQEAYLATGG